MRFRNDIAKVKKFFLALLAMALLSGLFLVRVAYTRGDVKYYSLSSPQVIINNGPIGSFDNLRTHTLSIVELNKNGYRFWGYYTGRGGNKINTDMGLAYSNDLINWVKEDISPVVKNLRWGTVVVVDGVINMFGTRNYGGDTYIVRLTSEDGKNFKEQGIVVPSVSGDKHQNPFIFYDENNKIFRLYYFHLSGRDNRIEEKHSSDIDRIADAPANIVMSDDENILAAPSIFYRDGKYWLTTETLRGINGKQTWETLAFVSDNPIRGFEPVDNNRILVDNDACFFPYLFDNQLNGVYSHRYENSTWKLFRMTHNFDSKNQIKLEEPAADLMINMTKQLTANLILPDGAVKKVTTAATWATSDNSIATVRKGKITAKKEGTAVITVSFGGVSATEYINVKSTET